MINLAYPTLLSSSSGAGTFFNMKFGAKIKFYLGLVRALLNQHTSRSVGHLKVIIKIIYNFIFSQT